MAVSSWNTGVEEASRGSTVFLFLIKGSLTAPVAEDSRALERAGRLIQRLLVLKNLCLRVCFVDGDSIFGFGREGK